MPTGPKARRIPCGRIITNASFAGTSPGAAKGAQRRFHGTRLAEATDLIEIGEETRRRGINRLAVELFRRTALDQPPLPHQ